MVFIENLKITQYLHLYSKDVYFKVTYLTERSVEKMKKTYKLLEHKEPLSIDEIRLLYKGYWVYIVKAKLGENGSILSGIPVIIGQTTADGVEDGIYSLYRSDEYNERVELNMLPNRGFISSLRPAEVSI